MKTTAKNILIVCLFLCTAFGYANQTIKTVCHQDGTPIIVKTAINYGSNDKSSSILASINGHSLTVVFLENLGTVHIEVTDLNGGAVALTDLYTPNGYIAYIYNTGSYIVTFTLTNGDEYYGEFDVTD